MKHLLLAAFLFLGVAVAAPAHAQNTASAASPSAAGSGVFVPGYGYYLCPLGTAPRYFFTGGVYYATGYDYRFYPPLLTTQPWWIPGPGVYCVP